MAYCSNVNTQGEIGLNVESKLQKELLKAFPNDKNQLGGSLYYDELFEKEFTDFYGQWFHDKDNDLKSLEDKWDEIYRKFVGEKKLFDDLGEPKLYHTDNEYYFVNHLGKRYTFNKKYLSKTDQIETINSLTNRYITSNIKGKSYKSIKNFIVKELTERHETLLDQLEAIENKLENEKLSIKASEELEEQLSFLRKKSRAIDSNILENNDILDLITKSILANLSGFSLKYVDEVEEKEDNPESNSDINNHTKDSTEVRYTNNLDEEVSKIISSIPQYEVDSEGSVIYLNSNLLDLPMSMDPNEVNNKLVELLSDIIELNLGQNEELSDPYDLMMNTLNEIAAENNILIKEFVNRVDAYYNKLSDINKEAFKTKFVTSFYKAKNIFSITEVSERNGRLILRHIDPTNTNDKTAIIANDFLRSLLNKFSYNNATKKFNNEKDYSEALKKLMSLKTKKDLIEGLNLLDITLKKETINKLFANRANVFSIFKELKGTNKKQTLKELFVGNESNEELGLFNQTAEYYNTKKSRTDKVSIKGLKKVLQAFVGNNPETQGNMVKSILDKDLLTPLYILARYEAQNKTDLSDNSMYVGSKQRWMYSLMSGMNKEILRWKAGDLTSLKNKQHKNLKYVDYLLNKDNLEKGNYDENSAANKEEISRRISKLQVLINSEIKKVADNNPVMHKEVGEADLHLDTFFKMFNSNDSIYEESLRKQTNRSKQAKYTNENIEESNIFNYGFLGDKSGSFSIKGLRGLNSDVVVDKEGKLKKIGVNNSAAIENYLRGELNEIQRNSDIIKRYIEIKNKTQKQAFLMSNMIDGYHYKIDKDAKDLSDSNNILTPDEINKGTWNKFGFFNSSYVKNIKEFNVLFQDYNGYILYNKGQKSKIKELSKFIEEDIINIANENKAYLDKLIIERSIDKNDKISETAIFKKPTNITNSTEDYSVYNYIVNSIFNNLEMFSLFNGNIGFYTQKTNLISMEDALKRGPATLSDGLYVRSNDKELKESQYSTFNNKKVKVNKNNHVVTAVVSDIKNKTSKFISEINKASGSKLTMDHEVADGQGFITLDFYKRIISGIYGWTEEDNKIFERLQDKNHKYNDEDIKWLKFSGRAMSSLKLTGFSLTDSTNEFEDKIEYPVFLKYSTAVLSPSLVKGTEVEKLYNQMTKQGVDQVVFKSGSKASNPLETKIHNADESGIFSDIKNDFRLNPFLFKLGDLKLQVELPTKFDKDSILGNQHFKNLLGNMNLNSNEKNYVFRGKAYTAKEIARFYENNAIGILQDQLDKLSKDVDIKLDKSGNFTFNQSKFRKLIIEQLDITTEQDLIDILKDVDLPIEIIPGIAQRMFPIIASYLHKNVGKIRTNGSSVIQIANIGFDKISTKDANNVFFLGEETELKPPLPQTDKDGNILYFDEDGNLTDKENGKMRIANAKMLLPFSSIFKETGMSYEEFKEAWRTGKIDKRIFETILGYRIPNQSISSNDSVEIIGILPPNMGDIAIVYNEITAKTGSDFDIDKMYLMMANYLFNKENGKLNYIDDESPKGKQNKMIELMQSILKSASTYNDLISPLDDRIVKIKETILKIIYQKEKQKSENPKEFMSYDDFEKSRKKSPLSQLSPVNMINARVDMLTAKKLVATMANHMTDIPMSQLTSQILKYDLKIDSARFDKIFALGHEGDNEWKLTKIVSYLMNAAVDAAKDNYIIDGNFNSYTSGPAMLMIRLGVTPENVFKVLLNDKVMAISKTKQLQTQKTTKLDTSEYSQEKLNEYSNNLIAHLTKNKINFNDFITKNKDFNDTMILGYWNILQLIGKEMNNDIVSSKPDSNGAGKNIPEHIVLLNRLERMKVESIGSNINDNFERGLKLFKQGINNHSLKFTDKIDSTEVTFLGAMMNNSLFLTNEIVKKMFIEATDNYRDVINRISNQFGNALPIDADNIKMFSNYIYPFVLSASGHNIYKFTNTNVDFLKNEFHEQLTQKKNQLKNNKFLNEIYIDASTNLISFPNFRFYPSNTKMVLKEEFNKLYLKYPEFVNKLVKYSFLTTGFKQTYFSFNEYMPNNYFIDSGHGEAINQLLLSLNNSSIFKEDEFIGKLMAFIAINNDNDYKIVKSSKAFPGVSDGVSVVNKESLEKITIKNTNNFYPFLKSKRIFGDELVETLYMLTEVNIYTGDKKGEYLVPTYKIINSNTELTNNKSKVKIFNLNNVKPQELFKGEDKEGYLALQQEIEYVSEVGSILKDNLWNIENDNVSLSTINNFKEEDIEVNNNTNVSVDKTLSWGQLMNKEVFSEEGINTMRTKNKEKSHMHFGNPFTGTGVKGLIQKESIEEAVQAYKDWLTTEKYIEVNPEQRQWIQQEINTGTLTNSVLLYMKDKGEYYSHADALADIVNNTNNKQGANTEEDKINIYAGRGENAELSNFANREFNYDGKVYQSVEHAYQTLKSGNFDESTYNRPNDFIGTKRNAPKNVDKTISSKLMKSLIKSSFEQNKNSLQKLLDTKNSILTHVGGNDKFWESEFHKLLMEVRNELKNNTEEDPFNCKI